MTVDEVTALIEQEADPRGIAHWEKRFPDSRLRSFGVGLTKLRKLAKKVGRDHELALKLWQSDVYEARNLAARNDEHRGPAYVALNPHRSMLALEVGDKPMSIGRLHGTMVLTVDLSSARSAGVLLGDASPLSTHCSLSAKSTKHSPSTLELR